MRDDARTRLARSEEGFEAIGVIHMAMGEDRGVDGRARLLAKHRGDEAPERGHAAVDEHDAFIGLETGDPAEARLEPAPLGDLDRAA